MSFGLPLTDALWADLYSGEAEEPEIQLSQGEWAWLTQVTQIPLEGRDISDPLSPAVEFRLRHEKFWICLKKSGDFPVSAPIVKCSFRPAFFFDWLTGEASEEKSSLSSVISQFRDYCDQMDQAIGVINSLEDLAQFRLSGYVLDEEETDFMVVHVDFEEEGVEEQLTLRIDWRSPNDFPSELSSSNNARFRDLDCDSWNSEHSLAQNMGKLYGLRVDEMMDTLYLFWRIKFSVRHGFWKKKLALSTDSSDFSRCMPIPMDTCCFCVICFLNLLFHDIKRMTSTAACIISQPKDVPSTEKQLHSIPSKIQYTGPADIDGYFIEEKGEDGSLRAAFRGRGLEGCQVQAPEGYHICVLKERLTSGATGPRRFDVVDRQSNFTFWEWDREAGANSQAARALAALKLAKALAED